MREVTAEKFQKTLDLLRDPDAPFTAEAVYSLSDLMGPNLDAFTALWPKLSEDRRFELIERLVETAETNFELDFSAVIGLALDDPDSDVRFAAVEGVFEESTPIMIERLVNMSKNDPVDEVRAAAVGALGPFILMGELGKLSEQFSLHLQEIALELHRNPIEDLDVRRRALEAVSNCGREDVHELIREAYYAEELPMRISAVFAMGRSCDDVWSPQVMEELTSDYSEMRYEAARAAGEIEVRKALPLLAEMAYEDDREIQEMAIWAMGEIGGQQAIKVLTQLAEIAEENEDDEMAEAIEEAQASAMLVSESLFPLLDFGDLDDEDDEFGDEFDLYGDLGDDDDDDDDLEDDDLFGDDDEDDEDDLDEDLL
jgi:HEAT repeat protein